MSQEITRRDVLKAAVALPLVGLVPVRDYTHVLERITAEEWIENALLYQSQGVNGCLTGMLRLRRIKPYSEAREGKRLGNISLTVIYNHRTTWEEAIEMSGVNPDNIDVRPEAR